MLSALTMAVASASPPVSSSNTLRNSVLNTMLSTSATIESRTGVEKSPSA